MKSTEPAATCESATQANEVEQNSADSDVSDGETLTMESGTKAESVGGLMEAVCERQNLKAAYQRVMKNKGAAGVDGMVVSEFKNHLQRHWPSIKAKLLAGAYMPQPIRQVEIPKPQGGVRKLGIPTLTDRLIQQAVEASRSYVAEGRPYVVDIDLEQFFDQINHNILMDKVAVKVRDKQVLKLIRRYLKAGVMAGGVSNPRTQGAPQGGPLSPLLSNILLTELDRELERRGHCFCRYADDCQIYVRSERAGERVLAGIVQFLEKRLKLRVNQSKSAVSRPSRAKFLGYSM
ncbi:MAG: RNA-directed DNA polymerase [Candidatus Azotimanducaceae bacterium]